MGAFADQILKFAPAWMKGPYGRSFLRSVGGVLDDFDERVFAGQRAGNPYAAGSKTDAGILRECDAVDLARHARDRGIRLYDSEPELSKRVRLSRWRQLKAARGSHKGELENLQPFWLSQPDSVLPWMRIFHQDNQGTRASICHTIDPNGVLRIMRSGSRWNYDAQHTKRTRFWLVIYLPIGYEAIRYDDGSVYDGGAIFDGVNTILVNDIVNAIKEAKAAHSRLAAVITTTLRIDQLVPGGTGSTPFNPAQTAVTLPDGSTTMPTGNWGTIIDSGTGLPTRPSYGSWVYEDPT